MEFYVFIFSNTPKLTTSTYIIYPWSVFFSGALLGVSRWVGKDFRISREGGEVGVKKIEKGCYIYLQLRSFITIIILMVYS